MLPISEIPFWFSLGENNQGYRLGDWIEEYWKATDTASWLQRPRRVESFKSIDHGP